MTNNTMLADYLVENYPIEQMRYQMYVEDDIYNHIPMLIFRFTEGTNNDVYVELRACLESFRGNLKWTLHNGIHLRTGKKLKNHMICPTRLAEMHGEFVKLQKAFSARDYFTDEEYLMLCDEGVRDISNLTKHIEKNFHPNF